MVCHNRGCLGNYDFDHIALSAQRRFVEGCNTLDLLKHANADREKEEITLVASMEIEDEQIQDLQVLCRFSEDCKVTFCRERLKMSIQDGLLKG
jgi:hypothetical protein